MEEDMVATEAIEVAIEVIEGLETADLHQEEWTHNHQARKITLKNDISLLCMYFLIVIKF